MAEYDQFAEVFENTGYTEFHEKKVRSLYEDGLFFIMDAGVPEAVAKSKKAVGCLTRYVLDTFNLTGTAVDLSPIFFRRLKQLTTGVSADAQNTEGKALDISQTVKKRVWERDGGRCVVCGSCVNVMPNAHFIPRSKGGLGIEQNIVTLCSELSVNQCHRRFDFGDKEERAAIGAIIEDYLREQYPGWDKKDLVYSKWS